MAITSNDIKLLASARMSDTADGGGRMTATVVVDNVENNLFPDLGTLDRATGAMQARKVYSGLLATGRDALMGAHLTLDAAPGNPAVSAVLVPAQGLAEEVSGLVARLNAAPLSIGFKGVATLTADLTVGATALAVSSTRAALIPAVRTAAAAAGSLDLAADGSVTGYVLSDADVDLSLLGTYWNLPSLNAVALGGGHYRLRVATPLPLQLARTTVTAGNRATVYFLAIPPGTEVGSESVQVTVNGKRHVLRAPPTGLATLDEVGVANVPFTLGLSQPIYGTQGYVEGYKGDFRAPGNGLMSGWVSGTAAFIDRAAGVISLTLGALPDLGSDIICSYAQGGSAALLSAGALGGGGVFSSGQLAVTVTAGRRLLSAAFMAGGVECSLRDGVVRNTGGVVLGAFNAGTGVLSVPALTGATVSQWRAVEADIAVPVATFSGTLPAALAPETVTITGTTSTGSAFSATADAQGQFASAGVSGTYDDTTGALALVFAAAVRSNTLAYAATQYSYVPATTLLPGLNSGAFAATGAVPVFALGDVVVLENVAETSPAAVANGATINCGRTGLSSAVLVDANGDRITTGYTVNLDGGLVNVISVAGWVQPVHARHWIKHTAALSAAPTLHGLQINLGPSRLFAAGSVVSSALILGTQQAAAGAVWSQETWTGVWQDSRIGNAIAAQYQDVSHPIEVDNLGAVTERWALIFTTNTAFRVVGETLGQIATGTINSDLAPVNDAVGAPYFTLRALGWGLGWPAGAVLRFNTRGAQGPAWVVRTTQPSEPWGARDLISIAQHGDINA